MSSLELDETTERIGTKLLRHLEWQPDGFSIIFLFADVGPSLQMADWLDQSLRLQGLPLYRQEVGDDFARDPEAMVDALIAQFALTSAQPGALWFGLQRHPNDAQWNLARRTYLARLNERRFLLERDLSRPLVLVLPANFRPETRDIAPDIWHVRALSAELRASAAIDMAEGGERDGTASLPLQDDGDLPDYREWQRIEAGGGAERIFLQAAWRAGAELLSAGRPGDAEQVAQRAAALARGRALLNPDNSTLRDLSLGLDLIGMVAWEQGNLARAENAYRESLALNRQLVQRLDGASQASRNLSISLDNFAEVVQARGDTAQATLAYSESLSLCRLAVERRGATPPVLRDLSACLAHTGAGARARGDWQQAAAAFGESLNINRKLAELPDSTAMSLRDLSISLEEVGGCAMVQGDWSNAEIAYRESLSLRRRLAAPLGPPGALRDLSVALDRVGDVVHAQGAWIQASVPYRESFDLRRKLVERLGGSPLALRDLTISLDNIARVASAQGDWQLARTLFSESLYRRRQLVECLGRTPGTILDLSVSLGNVGDTASATGDRQQAEQAYRENLVLRRELLDFSGGAPQALDDLAFSLWQVTNICPDDVAARDECIRILEAQRARFPAVAQYAERLTYMRGLGDKKMR